MSAWSISTKEYCGRFLLVRRRHTPDLFRFTGTADEVPDGFFLCDMRKAADADGFLLPAYWSLPKLHPVKRADDDRPTDEEIAMVKYFWFEKGDVERWAGWEETKHKFPLVARCVQAQKVAEDDLDRAVRQL